MTMATLSEVLEPARRHGYAVGGLVVLGWEDARAYVDAAEAEQAPVILQAGPGCRAHTPLPVLASMFRTLGELSDVPVVAHLDHGYTYDECREAVECGFTSVMFDGSRTGLQQNIDDTSKVVELAHSAGISCEGEIGFVGYDQGEASAKSDPGEAEEFAKATKVDALAVSVGNVHLQTTKAAKIDLEVLRAIEAVTDIPLVIHGGSGVPTNSREHMARNTAVCKFNIGTELSMAFGMSLREAVARDPERYNRVQILKETEEGVSAAARTVVRSLRHPRSDPTT